MLNRDELNQTFIRHKITAFDMKIIVCEIDQSEENISIQTWKRGNRV